MIKGQASGLKVWGLRAEREDDVWRSTKLGAAEQCWDSQFALFK